MESFYLKVKKLNIEDGNSMMIMINDADAVIHGLKAIDKISFGFDQKEAVVEVVVTPDIPSGFVGVFSDIWKKFKLKENELIKISYIECNQMAVEAIRKKIQGKKITEEETHSIIAEISSGRMSDILMTYYVASSFFYTPKPNELYYTAKAMAETGDVFSFETKDNIIADKHCIGGVPGNETTMIIVPIIASLGITIPKSFSKAITSPAATGECVNVLMGMEFDQKNIYKIVEKTNGCLIWGGGLNLAPADDKIIHVSYPLSLEPHSKAVISIMAKKYAMGINHCLIDIPVGKTAKVKDTQSALNLKKQFEYVGKHFGMKMKVEITEAKEPIGAGIGPRLQVREVLRVLQQHPERPLDLEKKAIYLAAKLIELCGYAKGSAAINIATEQIKLGKAWKKMQEIMKAQGANNINIQSEDLKLGSVVYEYKAKNDGIVREIDMKLLNHVCRILGCPIEETAGAYLHKKMNYMVDKGDVLFTLYTDSETRLKDALNLLEKKDMYIVE